MNCPYCDAELEYEDYYGDLNLILRGKGKKAGDIYRCLNEDCAEFQTYFHTRELEDYELHEGYPC